MIIILIFIDVREFQWITKQLDIIKEMDIGEIVVHVAILIVLLADALEDMILAQVIQMIIVANLNHQFGSIGFQHHPHQGMGL